MDYKDTVNLPRTDFPMKADLVSREPQRLESWVSSGLYAEIQAQRTAKPRFLLHDGPPFANGDVHIGTALNKILKDILIRYKTLRGFRAPYIPGWDCHGLPIEFKVSQELRKAGDVASDPASIRTACDAYARKYIGIQREQFKRLGILGDWDRPYLTLDKAYEAAELRLFADLVEKGFVYRGKKPVYWSIPCRTALAEAEVEYNDHVSQSVYVKFPVVDQPGTSVLIWTTTPWTLPANLAIAFNSTFSYSLVRVGGEALILSTFLVSAVAAACGWDNYEIVRSLDGSQLAGVRCRHPFIDRSAQLFPGDSFVENSTGTGFVHIAPGHGLDDYSLGLAHGLPIYSPVDDEGRLAHTQDLPPEQQMPGELVGKSILPRSGRSEANEAVIDLLSRLTMLVHRQDYTHSYPHCWRSKTPVIFRAMDQWFIRIDHHGFRDQAVDEISRIQWIPDWGQNRIEGAVKARPDWCISRQRSWGVPIPAFYDAAGQAILDPRVVRATADLVERSGSNAWFERSASELWALVRPSDWSGAEPVARSQDTLDVWIDSGSSSRAVLQARPELAPDPGSPADGWRADVYLEGSDQHRGWFQSSLLLSLAAHGAAPYRTVLTHGFMVDADREKISKSKQGQGGYEKPQTADAYVKRYGADVVRLWVASQDFRNDIVVSEERINKVGETYRNIRNTLRYQLSNLYDFDPAHHAIPDARMDGLDRWILDAFSRLEQEVAQAYDASEFHVVYQKLSQFVAVELSATYHDLVKDRLYTDPASSPRRRSTQTALHRLVTGLTRLLSPILVFTADEAWEVIPDRPVRSVHCSDLTFSPPLMSESEAALWVSLFALRERCLPELERVRQAKTIGKALDAALLLRGSDPLLTACSGHLPVLQELLNVSQLTITTDAGASQALTVEVQRAGGAKCSRCWHWEVEVGADAEHPALCPRCVAAVTEWQSSRA